MNMKVWKMFGRMKKDHNFEVDDNSDSDEDRINEMLSGLENQLRDDPL